MIAMNISRKK